MEVSVSKYSSSYGKALKFSMSTVPNLLEQLAHPSHVITRGGGERADHTFRGVAADALQDEGRDHEAELLRNPEQHVVVHEGKVKPGRYTDRLIREAANRLSNTSEAVSNEQFPGLYPFNYSYAEGSPTFHTVAPLDDPPVIHYPLSQLGGYMAEGAEDDIRGHDRRGLLNHPDIQEGLKNLRNAPHEEPVPDTH